jgi:predicted phage terminase large subunit-like protein
MASSPTTMYTDILKNDLCAFFHRSFLELNGGSVFLPNWHLEVLAAKLEDVRQGRCRRLIINMPPRFLKSLATTVAFPAWLLGHDPTKKILCVGYAQDVSNKFARESRTLMMSPFYRALFDTRISEERQAVEEYETTKGGSRVSTSVGGIVTSRGADIIIVDDPMKAEEAISDVRRNSLKEWYDNTLRSRLNYQETGAIIIVMQRLHIDDLVGHVQENEDWEVLSFPAIAVEDTEYEYQTPYGRRRVFRREGEVLQPALQSAATLEKLRRGMTDYNFTAQYQQNPAPRAGNIVKTQWLKFYEPGSEPADFQWTVQSWDTANKAAELNDYSVCTTWGVKDKMLYLLDVFRKRLNYPDLKRAVMDLNGRFPRSTVLIEDKASGTQLIQELMQNTSIPVKAWKQNSSGDKIMRLHAQTIYFDNGRILLPQDAPWLKDYIAEITAFPTFKYADQVDSTTQFLEWYGDCGSYWESYSGVQLYVAPRDEPWPPNFDILGR